MKIKLGALIFFLICKIGYAQQTQEHHLTKKNEKKTFYWRANEKNIFGDFETNALIFEGDQVTYTIDGTVYASGRYYIFKGELSLAMITEDDLSLYYQGSLENEILTLRKRGQEDRVFHLQREEFLMANGSNLGDSKREIGQK